MMKTNEKYNENERKYINYENIETMTKPEEERNAKWYWRKISIDDMMAYYAMMWRTN